jgi:hypothetical protein
VPKTWSYFLRRANNSWLAEVVLVENGMFAAVSDYGNFAYYWTGMGSKEIREFVLQLEIGYFADKMAASLAYTTPLTKKVLASCKLFSEQVLPVLQDVILKELALSLDSQ